MPAAFGTLIERLVGAEIFFAPDGELIGAAAAAISATVKPATAGDYADYNLGRVQKIAYQPTTKDRSREWASPTGGYKNRKDTQVVEDAFVGSLIDYAPFLFDQMMFGTAGLADPADGAQQAFEKGTRYKDGWLLMKRYNENGTAITTLEIHARLYVEKFPEDMNEPGTPEFRIIHLADAGALDEITPVAD